MNTPIHDFITSYAEKKTARFHMPGHKGKGSLGIENFDITEIDGADVLYSPKGIILESENNASRLFGTEHTFYSAEGSTLAIKAMLSLVKSASQENRPTVVAAINVHKAFIYAAALLDLDVEWIASERASHLCACPITPAEAERAILGCAQKPCAFYLTSPDYLGNIADIEGISKVCRAHGIPLLVDNAHGAYLAFLKPSLHPIALGADMCCDSAHKTLPALTGGAYLHISKNTDPKFALRARDALALFASTSPSYLILDSLDLCNKYISDGYSEKLFALCLKAEKLRDAISEMGYSIIRGEPLKIVIEQGYALGEHLRSFGIEPELCDRCVTVLMLTPSNTDEDTERLLFALSSFVPSENNEALPFSVTRDERVMSVREAIFSLSEDVTPQNAVGRICAYPTVTCPPAVPIAMSGERISERTVKLLQYYGIDRVSVVKQS